MPELDRRNLIKAASVGTVLPLFAGCLGTDDDSGGGTTGTDDDSGGGTTTEDLPGPEDDVEYDQVRDLVWTGVTRDFNLARYQAQDQLMGMWQELGVDIEMDVLEFSVVSDRFDQHDYDIMTMWNVGRPERIDPLIMMGGLHSRHSEVGGHNMVRFRHSEYDAVIDELRETYEYEERKELADQAQALQASNLPEIYDFHQRALGAANTNQFENWTPQLSNWVYWNVYSLANLEPVGDNDTVIMGTASEITKTNIMDLSGDQNWHLAHLIYDSLTRAGLQGEPKNWAASDIDVADETTIDVTIRDGMVWHDGEPFTAEDVKFTADYLQEYGVPYLAQYYEVIESTEILDDMSVRFNIEEPDSTFPDMGLSQFFILPKHVWDGVTEEENLEHPREWTNPDMTGSGPFQAVEVRPEEEVVLETHHDHPAADYDFDRLIWNVYGSETAAVGDLESDRIAFVPDLTPTMYEQVQNTEHIKREALAVPGVMNWRIKNDDEPFHDLAFRRALAHANDSEEIINVSLEDHGDPAHHMIAPSNEAWYNGDVMKYEGGLEGAQELLIDAGYRWDEDGNLLRPVDRNLDNHGVEYVDGDYVDV